MAAYGTARQVVTRRIAMRLRCSSDSFPLTKASSQPAACVSRLGNPGYGRQRRGPRQSRCRLTHGLTTAHGPARLPICNCCNNDCNPDTATEWTTLLTVTAKNCCNKTTATTTPQLQAGKNKCIQNSDNEVQYNYNNSTEQQIDATV
ncbi:hypothetical protein RRG08_043459 [Elysia crispata]|uniref:Uncharacterized protein n=1 Tax=Elysia crispata TaxID=231223 RepID=A0AAE0XPJ7_9GAST|nr:hypothetical protein RRG08_043459 [Elysia crispata]